MSVIAVRTLEHYLQAFDRHVRQFSPLERRLAVTIYRELANGGALDPERLGKVLGISQQEVRTLLECDPLRSFLYLDKHGRILGFGGLSTVPTHHHFEIDGRDLFTWCAGDALFIPAYLGQSARIKSSDPENGELVQVSVAPNFIEAVTPEGAAISFIQPESNLFDTSAENVQKSYCHYIFFFASHASGEQWVAKHPGTFLCSLEDWFTVSKELAARIFGPAPTA